MKYRITIYDGFFTYSGMISREYKNFPCVDDAKIYAYGLVEGTGYAYDVQEVRQ